MASRAPPLFPSHAPDAVEVRAELEGFAAAARGRRVSPRHRRRAGGSAPSRASIADGRAGADEEDAGGKGEEDDGDEEEEDVEVDDEEYVPFKGGSSAAGGTGLSMAALAAPAFTESREESRGLQPHKLAGGFVCPLRCTKKRSSALMVWKHKQCAADHIASVHFDEVLLCPMCPQVFKKTNSRARHLRCEHQIPGGSGAIVFATMGVPSGFVALQQQ